MMLWVCTLTTCYVLTLHDARNFFIKELIKYYLHNKDENGDLSLPLKFDIEVRDRIITFIFQKFYYILLSVTSVGYGDSISMPNYGETLYLNQADYLPAVIIM
jgi:hypothetical protein